jgi:hypothetical protein
LERLFNVQWTTPKEYLLKEFLQTWEVTKDGKIKVQVWGKKIVSD